MVSLGGMYILIMYICLVLFSVRYNFGMCIGVHVMLSLINVIRPPPLLLYFLSCRRVV